MEEVAGKGPGVNTRVTQRMVQMEMCWVRSVVGGAETWMWKKNHIEWSTHPDTQMTTSEAGGSEQHQQSVSLTVFLLRCCTLYYNFVRRYPWGRPSEGCTGSVCIIYYNCVWIYNYLKVKRLIEKRRELSCQTSFTPFKTDVCFPLRVAPFILMLRVPVKSPRNRDKPGQHQHLT